MTITSRGRWPRPVNRRHRKRAVLSTSSAPLDSIELDAVVTLVADHAPDGPRPDAAARADLLQQVIDDTMAAEDDWLAAACEAKGLAPGTTEAGEELFSGHRDLRPHGAAAPRLRCATSPRTASPPCPGPVREAPGGRLRVQVFPDGAFDRITFPQTTAEVWMQPGVTRASLVEGQAAAYADPAGHAGTALVLAAGNVASLGPRDALSKLFVEGKIGRDEGQPGQRLPRAALDAGRLAPLLDAGVLRIVEGGAGGGPVPDGPRAHRRGAHHRIRQDLRRRRVRQRSRRASAARRPTSRCWTSRSRPSSATCHR